MRNLILILGVIASLFLVSNGQTEPDAIKRFTESENATIMKIAHNIPKADFELVLDVVSQAGELAYEDFPRKEDILAIIAVESTFRPHVTDGLGSCGLMQVNARANSLDENEVCNNPMINMIYGVKIAREYFERLGTPRKALLAYNAGIGNFLKGRYNPNYYTKFTKWKDKLRVT